MLTAVAFTSLGSNRSRPKIGSILTRRIAVSMLILLYSSKQQAFMRPRTIERDKDEKREASQGHHPTCVPRAY
jgi:hypothetical protein